MESLLKSVKKIKLLSEWPLSKVELVEYKNKKYIVKTIHKDFAEEIDRQKTLENVLQKPLAVPHIYETQGKDGNVSFLMDFIEGDNPTDEEYLSCIELFHQQTVGLKDNNLFPLYSIEQFKDDLCKVKSLLPENDFFENSEIAFSKVFSSDYSVVHGDWKNGQLIKSNGIFYIVDFGKSFYGPSILDAANFLNDTPDHRNSLAELVLWVITLSWFVTCRDRYINYDYKKEIASVQNSISKVRT